jgi:hypothetical protein
MKQGEAPRRLARPLTDRAENESRDSMVGLARKFVLNKSCTPPRISWVVG